MERDRVEAAELQELARLVKECRVVCCYRQSEFAKIVGVKPETIKSWETGEHAPTDFNRECLVDAMAVCVARKAEAVLELRERVNAFKQEEQRRRNEC